jgi:hypothetical protein
MAHNNSGFEARRPKISKTIKILKNVVTVNTGFK